MEHPGFRIRRHFDELETGMHVWICDVPPAMKVPRLLTRLQADIPPCRHSQVPAATTSLEQYIIDLPDL